AQQPLVETQSLVRAGAGATTAGACSRAAEQTLSAVGTRRAASNLKQVSAAARRGPSAAAKAGAPCVSALCSPLPKNGKDRHLPVSRRTLQRCALGRGRNVAMAQHLRRRKLCAHSM